MDRIGPVPQLRASGPEADLLAFQPLLVPVQLRLPARRFFIDNRLRPVFNPEEQPDLAERCRERLEAEPVDVQARNTIFHPQLIADILGGTCALQHIKMGAVHRSEVIIGAVAGKRGQHLNPQPLEIIHHHFLVTLNVIFTHIINYVIARNLRLHRTNLAVNPGNIDLVMAA
ncbi:hypothetical protein D3C73_1097930 [compost metagenome]